MGPTLSSVFSKYVFCLINLRLMKYDFLQKRVEPIFDFYDKGGRGLGNLIILDKIQVLMAILFTHGCHDSELLLGATVYHSGNWTTMIRDGKASIQVQLRNRINALKKICQFTDLKTRKSVASGLIQKKLPLYSIALFSGTQWFCS